MHLKFKLESFGYWGPSHEKLTLRHEGLCYGVTKRNFSFIKWLKLSSNEPCKNRMNVTGPPSSTHPSVQHKRVTSFQPPKCDSSTHPSVQHKKNRQFDTKNCQFNTPVTSTQKLFLLIFIVLNWPVCWTDGFLLLNWRVFSLWSTDGCAELRLFMS